MPKATIDPLVQDPIAAGNFEALHQIINGGMGIDNFNYQVIEGTTSSESDGETLIQHSMRPQPAWAFPLVGDVYIQNITDTFIDIRSTKKNVQFKVVCVRGPKIIDETATNPDDFVDTVGVIEEAAPQDLRPNFFDLNFTPYLGETVSGKYSGCMCVGDYIIVARHNKTSGDLYRVNIATGVVDTLVLNASRSVGAMYYDGTSLWVADMKTYGTTNINVYQVNPISFTITSTVVCNVNNTSFTHCAAILVTSDAIYIAGRSQAGTQRGWLARCNKGTGAAEGQILGVATGNDGFRCFKSIHQIGSNFYVVDGALSPEIRIVEFSGNPIAISTTYASSFTAGYQTSVAAEVNGKLYCPVVHRATAASTPSDYGHYSPAVVEFDPGTGNFTRYPLNTGGGPLSSVGPEDPSQPFLANAIAVGPHVYFVGLSGSDTQLIRFDTINLTTLTGVLPLGHRLLNFLDGNTGDNELNILNTVLIRDPVDGEFFVIKQVDGSSATPVLENFEYFKPRLSDYEGG